MKKIKEYRAWFPDHKVMNYDVGIFNNKAILPFKGDFSEAANPCLLMEYIGINDKYNNKLYEDDIVILHSKSDDKCKGIPTKFIVVFSKEHVAFALKSTLDRTIEPLYNFRLKNIKKIGNIHDNPKLLND